MEFGIKQTNMHIP